MLEAKGRLVLFTDADLSAPIEEADKLLGALVEYDVAIGSRALDRRLISVRQSLFREYAGILFNLIVRAVLRLPFVDTQCGFKAFRREPCRIVFQQQRIEPAGGGNSRALGALAGHENKHAARQHADVSRCVPHSLERADRPLPAAGA